MEKDIGKLQKNEKTDIIVRIDDFGGRTGLTIREFLTGSDGGYSGFTKAGTRIPAEKVKEFKEMINSIDEKDLDQPDNPEPSPGTPTPEPSPETPEPEPAAQNTI